VDHGLRNLVEHGVTLLQGLHSHSPWQGHEGVFACLAVSWTIWNSVVREDPQAVIKDRFEGRTWVVLKIDGRITCPRFQPDGTEQDTRYVQTFLYAIGDGVCSISLKNDCQRNAGLHSCSLLCWITWKHLPLACCTSEFASVQGVWKKVCSGGKHLCSSDQFQAFSYHTLTLPPHFFFPPTDSQCQSFARISPVGPFTSAVAQLFSTVPSL